MLLTEDSPVVNNSWIDLSGNGYHATVRNTTYDLDRRRFQFLSNTSVNGTLLLLVTTRFMDGRLDPNPDRHWSLNI